MGQGPEGTLLDRIDNNGNYCKENCRWANSLDSSLNRRINKNNKSGIRGVCWIPSENKWRATLAFNFKTIFLGHFEIFEDAHQEYLRYYFLIHGEYPPEFY
jgi:hypothetical protein